MLCSCRLSPLRALLSSMAQLHVSEPAAAATTKHISNNLPRFQTIPRSPFSTTLPRPRASFNNQWDAKKATAKQDAQAAKATQTSSDERSNSSRPRKPRSRRPTNDEADGDLNPHERERKHRREHWQVQKEALKEKFPEGWNPRKRLSPDAIAGIKALHAQSPEEYTTTKLSSMFEVSPEAIRRILRSKWQASPEEEQDRQERWFRRGVSVWSRYAEMGVKPPRKWRREGVARDPAYHDRRKAAIEKRKEEEAAEDKGEKLQRKLGGSIM
ncbi:Required for respiratory growth protein 9 [Colletotrichum siamense]|uniref:Required for respiratory growth protein 9, mitochondrial n=1 Tax=Colletotrichum siamense TaxID=690259 RepID=A0A9P5EPD5_COLSI|nr:Required for respiratory growth protein 9 [Colletotrichum siamense]KAF4856552.1 Required for respiratory growth protein 9 [Colletotrichum siamense]